MLHKNFTGSIGEILILISSQPNFRKKPLPGDLEGEYDGWFDGGAVRHDTGISIWTLNDGTKVSMLISPDLHISITFKDQQVIHVSKGNL